MLDEKERREGVDMRMGVWRDSDSVANVDEVEATGLVGRVILGLGFSILTGGFFEGPGMLNSTGSILMAPKEEAAGVGSESESDSSILQIGR